MDYPGDFLKRRLDIVFIYLLVLVFGFVMHFGCSQPGFALKT